jgi:hypothetical protein
VKQPPGHRRIEGPALVGLTPGEVDPHHVPTAGLHSLGFDHTRLTDRFQGRDFRLTHDRSEVGWKLLA